VGFRSLQESIDTTTPGGRLVFHIFGSLVEFERDLIQERTRAGLAAARARGRWGGLAHGADRGQGQAGGANDRRRDTAGRGRHRHRGVAVHAVSAAAPEGARPGAVSGQVFVDGTKHRDYLMVAAVLLPADVAPLRRGGTRAAAAAHEQGERTAAPGDRGDHRGQRGERGPLRRRAGRWGRAGAAACVPAGGWSPTSTTSGRTGWSSGVMTRCCGGDRQWLVEITRELGCRTPCATSTRVPRRGCCSRCPTRPPGGGAGVGTGGGASGPRSPPLSSSDPPGRQVPGRREARPANRPDGCRAHFPTLDATGTPDRMGVRLGSPGDVALGSATRPPGACDRTCAGVARPLRARVRRTCSRSCRGG